MTNKNYSFRVIDVHKDDVCFCVSCRGDLSDVDIVNNFIRNYDQLRLIGMDVGRYFDIGYNNLVMCVTEIGTIHLVLGDKCHCVVFLKTLCRTIDMLEQLVNEEENRVMIEKHRARVLRDDIDLTVIEVIKTVLDDSTFVAALSLGTRVTIHRLFFKFLVQFFEMSFNNDGSESDLDSTPVLLDIMSLPEVIGFSSLFGVQKIVDIFIKLIEIGSTLILYFTLDLYVVSVIKFLHISKYVDMHEDESVFQARLDVAVILVDTLERVSQINGNNGEWTNTDDLAARSPQRSAPKRKVVTPKNDRMCHQFQRNGTCQWGENCRFSHGPEGGCSGRLDRGRKVFVECELEACKQRVHYHKSQSKQQRVSPKSNGAERRLMAKQGKVDLCNEVGEVKYFRCNNRVEDCGSHYHQKNASSAPVVLEIADEVVADDAPTLQEVVEPVVEDVIHNIVLSDVDESTIANVPVYENVVLPPSGVQDTGNMQLVVYVPPENALDTTNDILGENDVSVPANSRVCEIDILLRQIFNSNEAWDEDDDTISELSFVQDSVAQAGNSVADSSNHATVNVDTVSLSTVGSAPLHITEPIPPFVGPIGEPFLRTEIQNIFYCSTHFGKSCRHDVKKDWIKQIALMLENPGITMLEAIGLLRNTDTTGSSNDFFVNSTHNKELAFFGTPIVDMSVESFVRFSTAVGYDTCQEQPIYPVVFEWIRDDCALKQLINPKNMTASNSYESTVSKVVIDNLVRLRGAEVKIGFFDQIILSHTFAYAKNYSVYRAFLNRLSNPSGSDTTTLSKDLFFQS